MAELLPSGFWGGTAVRPGQPKIEILEEAKFVPFKNPILPWGLFDSCGILSMTAVDLSPRMDFASCYGVAAHITQPIFLETDSLAPLATRGVAPKQIYAGLLNMHFGHFLTDFFSRLWFVILPEFEERDFVICYTAPEVFTVDNIFSYSWFSAIMQSLKLSSSNFFHIIEPTHFTKLFVPAPSMRGLFYVHRSFRELALAANSSSRTIYQTRDRTVPVYLSKTRLSRGISRIANEIELETFLREQGIEIIYPEMLSLAEQISVFENVDVILGTTGSAFHVSVFCKTVPKILGVHAADHTNSNFKLIDLVTGAESALNRAGFAGGIVVQIRPRQRSE